MSIANRVARRHLEAAGYAIGPRGLEETESGITLQKGAMYGMGASSSPQLVVLTDVSDSKIKYKVYPFQGSDKTIERWIGQDLLAKGTRTHLKYYGAHMDKLVKSSMESLLQGGKGRVENLDDYKPIRVLTVSADPDVDEWRTAEQYGNVGGLIGKDGETQYEIDTYQKTLPEIKKDRRLKVLKVEPRRVAE